MKYGWHIEAGWHIYVAMNWVIIGSGSGLAPMWCQAITWINDDLSPTGPQGTHFNEVLFEVWTFSFKKLHLELVLVEKMLRHFVQASICWVGPPY